MDWISGVAIAGSVASIFGLLVAFVQTMRLKALKRKKNLQIWGNIALTVQAFERLEPLKNELSKTDGIPADLKVRVIAARQAVVDQYIRLIEEAALDETNFDEETVDKWCESGRLENEWRRKVALRFVPTKLLR